MFFVPICYLELHYLFSSVAQDSRSCSCEDMGRLATTEKRSDMYVAQTDVIGTTLMKLNKLYERDHDLHTLIYNSVFFDTSWINPSVEFWLSHFTVRWHWIECTGCHIHPQVPVLNFTYSHMVTLGLSQFNSLGICTNKHSINRHFKGLQAGTALLSDLCVYMCIFTHTTHTSSEIF